MPTLGEQVLKLARDLTSVDRRLEYAERRVRSVKAQQFIDGFMITDLGELGMVDTYLDFVEGATPDDPSSGVRRVWANTATSKLSVRTSAGATINLEYGDAEAIAAVEGEATLNLTGDVTIVGAGKSLEVINFKFETATELTISSGDITVTQVYHKIDTESDAGSDNLDGITGGADGEFLLLRPENDGRTIVVRHNQNAGATKNILLSGGTGATLDDISDTLMLVYDATLDTNGAWVEVARTVPPSAVHVLLDGGTIHTDTATDGVTEGSLIIGNATPAWDELIISVPAANVRNVLGVDNAEATASWKTALDATNPANVAAAASPGTSLVFAHRDHVHKMGVLTTKGDVLSYSTTPARLGVGANDTILMADSGQTTGLKWAAPASPGAGIDIGDSAAEGSADTWARSDHQHGFTAPGAGYPLNIANTESDGTATTPARADHVHAHPAGLTANLHHAKYLNSEAITAVEGETTLDLAGDVTIIGAGKSLEVLNFKFETATELTISGGDVAATQAYHRIDTEGDAASDNLDGITGGADGEFLLLRPEDDAHTVTVRHNQNAANVKNILLSEGISAILDNISDMLLLVYDATLDTNGAWVEVSRTVSPSTTHALLDGTVHTDTVAQGATEGSLIIGNATPAWDELTISVPAANVRNVLGVDNGETTASWKTALDATNPAAVANAAAAGTSLVFAHRDHAHKMGVITTKGDILSWSTVPARLGVGANDTILMADSGQTTGLKWAAPASPSAGIDIGDSAAEGSADTWARSDHQHTFTAPGAGYPLDIANAEADGTATTPARADHVHAHPAGLTANLHHNAVTIGADAAHSLATQVLSAVLAANGQTGHMSGAMFDKLDGIEASADQTDATNVAAAGAVMDSDISPGEGFLRKTGAGAYTAHKSNLSANAAPVAADDDADAGYSVGSVWIDTTNDNAYVCVDSTNNAAVWLHLNAAAAVHKDSHDPVDGADALDTAVPSRLTPDIAQAIGTGHEFSRADHEHQVTCDTPLEISVVVGGSEGTDSYNFARADHVHAINHAITDNHIVTVDGTTNAPVVLDYAKWTTLGLEGRTYAQVLSDLSAQADAAFDWGGQDLGNIGAAALAGILTVDTVNEKTADAGVTFEGVKALDSFLEFSEIAIPSAPAASKGRLLTPLLTTNDSLTPGTDETGLYYRRNDGLMVKLNDDFPYSTKMRHPRSASAPWGDANEPPMGNNWVNFDWTYSVSSFTKDFLGCVWVQGLIKSGAVGTTIFTLPEGYRNTGGHLFWAAISNSAFGLQSLLTGGLVTPNAGSNTWFSLCRMAFPETSRITWHDVGGGGGGEPAFENSWANYAAGGFDTAGFAKDAIGRVWIKGLVKDGVAATVFTLPAGYRPTADIIMVSASNNNVIAEQHILADGSVKVTLLGAGTNDWANIDIVFTADGAATWTAATFKNSWVDFGGAWDTAAFYKDACGIVHIKGLIKDGTVGQEAFTLPVGYRPKRDLYFPVLSNSAIGSMRVNEDGAVVAQSGNNTWYSVHCSFIAEQ